MISRINEQSEYSLIRTLVLYLKSKLYDIQEQTLKVVLA